MGLSFTACTLSKFISGSLIVLAQEGGTCTGSNTVKTVRVGCPFLKTRKPLKHIPPKCNQFRIKLYGPLLYTYRDTVKGEGVTKDISLKKDQQTNS